MPNTAKKKLKELYERIRKGLKELSGASRKEQPQWVLQPYQPKKNLRGY